MIQFHRITGQPVALNPDLIERIEETPDTVITLLDDKKFLVAESLDEVIRLIVDYRAYVIARANDLTVVDETRPTLHLVPNDVVVTAPEPPARLQVDPDEDPDGDSDGEGSEAEIIDCFGDMEIS